MTSLSSPINPLGPVTERWLVGAVIELSSSEVGRAAAAAWLLTYERARALGWDPNEAVDAGAVAGEATRCSPATRSRIAAAPVAGPRRAPSLTAWVGDGPSYRPQRHQRPQT